MLIRLLTALGLTLALELAFALLWGVKGRRDLILVVLVNVLTNPPVNLLFHLLADLRSLPALPVLITLEVSAVAVEWLYYRKTDNGIHHPLPFSLCANGFSYCAGHLLQLFL